jgi:hypothetical protein
MAVIGALAESRSVRSESRRVLEGAVTRVDEAGSFSMADRFLGRPDVSMSAMLGSQAYFRI